MHAHSIKLITTSFLVMTLLGGPNNSLAALVILDRIAAVVDDDVIMQSEVETRVKQVKSQLAANQPQGMPPDEILQKQVVERLVVENLQLQMAQRAGVRVSDAELSEAMRRIAEQNQLSLAGFRQALERDGVSYASMREQIAREIMIGRVQQGIMRRRIDISDQEIDAFLESELGANITADEYRLGHILLSTPSEASTAQLQSVKREADRLIAMLNDGASFQTLAVEKSAGQNALEGGDLGWRKPAQLPTMFSDIAQSLEVGEVYGPIKSGSGFHVIKLIQKRGASAEGQVPQTRVRHVLIQVSEIRSLEEARDLANTLRTEIAEGRAFDEVAKLYSDDPGSALAGGDLGWSRPEDFVGEFASTMENSRINELSDIFRTEFGYHFLEVTDRRIEDFSERFKRAQAENFLRNQMFDEELETWLREIREDAFVEIRTDT